MQCRFNLALRDIPGVQESRVFQFLNKILNFSFLILITASCAYERTKLESKLESEIKASDQGLIPTAAFFGDSSYHDIKMSPDGRFLGAMYSENGKKMLAIVSRDVSKLYHVVRFVGNVDVIDYDWANNERLIVRAGETFGNLDGRYSRIQHYFVNYDGTGFKDFFSKEWASFGVLNLTPDDPKTIVMVKHRHRSAPVAVKFNINTGTTQTIGIPPRSSSGILANSRGEANVAIITDKDDRLSEKVEIAVRLDGVWETVMYPSKGDTPIEPILLDSESGDLYLLSSRETGKKGLYAFNVRNKSLRTIFVHEKVDVLGLYREDDRVVGLYFENGRPEVVILDGESITMKVFKAAQNVFPDEIVTGITLTQDKKSASFRVHSDRSPSTYYLMEDVSKIQFKLLGESNKVIREADLGPREPFHFKARDGLEIPGYITLPKGADLKEKRPTLVMVHGGPFGPRDSWAFHAESQYYATRGYVVMQVNFRGSGGYGVEFLRAGWKQWGKAMQDDITDATKWAIAEGIADPARICIIGASYGGYAAMQGVVKEPDLYKCAINFVGVTDLTLHGKKGNIGEIRGVDKWVSKTLGDDQEELKKYSPNYHADKIKVPVFIVHGADDRQVPLIHAELMREALDKHKKPYEWLVKTSEGHGFVQPANRIELHHAKLKFIEKAIGKGGK